MASIQTFGSAVPFHPHVHALATDGLFLRAGTFLPLEPPDVREIEEIFRRILIAALQEAERLSEEFAERLLSWDHSGFSAYAEQVVLPHERDRFARLARYMARAAAPSPRYFPVPSPSSPRPPSFPSCGFTTTTIAFLGS